jgi:hypothetical protein
MIRDKRVQIDVLGAGLRQPLVKGLGGFPAGLALFVSHESTLHDIGDRTPLAPRQPVREIAGEGAADGELRLRHRGDLADAGCAIKPSADGLITRDQERPLRIRATEGGLLIAQCLYHY